MVAIAKLITAERIVCLNQMSSKKRILELLSEMLATGESTITQTEIFASLCGRERLGSTGLGNGVAIPHGRLKNLNQPIGAFIQTKNGVDYDAIDGRPVDLICALMVPEESTEEHLDILAQLAGIFSDKGMCEQMRAAKNNDDIYALLASTQPQVMERHAGHSA